MKKITLLLFSVFLIFFAMLFLFENKGVSYADEDDEDEYEERSENEERSEDENNEDQKVISNPNTEKTIESKTGSIITQKTTTSILKDTDGDGLFDTEDPHPSISEIYIVQDNNQNGIVDTFEASP